MTTTHSRPRSWWRGRSEFIMVGIVATFAAILLIGSLTMEIRGQSTPAPNFVSLTLAGGLALIAIALAVDIAKNPEVPSWDHASGHHNFSVDLLHDVAGMTDEEDTYLQAYLAEQEEVEQMSAASVAVEETNAKGVKEARYSDKHTLFGIIAASFIFVLIIKPVGWIISAAALFWVSAYFLGSRRPIFDIGIGLIVSSVIQLLFSGVMGLSLPAGFIGGF